MLFVIFLFAIVADLYIFFRYVWRKCQWRTRIQYAAFSSLSYMLAALIFRKYFLTDSVSVLYEIGVVMGVFLSLFVSKSVFFIVDVWTLIFKTKVLKWIAVGLTAWGFLSCMYGMMFGRFNISAKRVDVENKSLPRNFDGYKILQISDLHLSSFHSDEKIVADWVDMMNAENPDIICFTGDMVSVFADEMLPFMDALKRLKAKEGKFAILGNHDYGDYHSWKSAEEKESHNERLKSLIRSAGFDLLLDEHRLLTKGGDTLAVVGLEDMGRLRNCQKKNLEKAELGLTAKTRILLSHKPDFWETYLDGNTDYFLTLAGHTHAMQAGIEIGDWEFSLSFLRYPYWHGLYERNGNQIFVSRGIGCNVIPIRFGMTPEYVVITLKK